MRNNFCPHCGHRLTSSHKLTSYEEVEFKNMVEDEIEDFENARKNRGVYIKINNVDWGEDYRNPDPDVEFDVKFVLPEMTTHGDYKKVPYLSYTHEKLAKKFLDNIYKNTKAYWSSEDPGKIEYKGKPNPNVENMDQKTAEAIQEANKCFEKSLFDRVDRYKKEFIQKINEVAKTFENYKKHDDYAFDDDYNDEDYDGEDDSHYYYDSHD